MTTDLAQATPPEIDSELADLYSTEIRQWQHLEWAIDFLHHLAGDKRNSSQGPWSMSHEEVLAAGPEREYDRARFDDQVAKLNGLLAERAALKARQAELEDEYNRRPWSRFFLVRNHGGHIHRSMNCSTCFYTTLFGWLPALSGLSEAEAVAAHGAILCTVCFPSAPVEWTSGKLVDPDTCPGSGRYVAPVNGANAYRPYGDCPVCGHGGSLTSTFKVRKHKKPKES